MENVQEGEEEGGDHWTYEDSPETDELDGSNDGNQNYQWIQADRFADNVGFDDVVDGRDTGQAVNHQNSCCHVATFNDEVDGYCSTDQTCSKKRDKRTDHRDQHQ